MSQHIARVGLLVGLLIGTTAQAGSPSCVDAFGARSAVGRAEADQLVKNYLAMNLAFPQNPYIIYIGLTASFIARPEIWKAREQISPEDFERVWTAMSRAHAAHGIKVDVSQTRAGRTMMTFLNRLEAYTLRGVSKITMLPDEIPRFPGKILTEGQLGTALWNEVLTNEVYAGRRANLVRYSESILEILKSPTVRELSTRLRLAAAASHQRVIQEQGVSEISVEIRRVLAAQLIERHPELNVPFAKIYPPAKSWPQSSHTHAEMLIEAMAGDYTLNLI